MKEKISLRGFLRRLCASNKSESGYLLVGVALVIAATLLTNLSLVKSIINSGMSLDAQQEVNDCIKKVTEARKGLEARRIDDPTADITDDVDYKVIKVCQDKMTKLQNDIKSGKVPNLAQNAAVLNGLIGDTIKGFTIGTCTMDEPTVGTAGIEYSEMVQVQIPFSGTDMKTSLNMSGAVTAQGELREISDKAGSWSGRLSVPGSASQDMAGKTSIINVIASAPFIDTTTNRPYEPCSTCTCPDGTSLDPASKTCKTTCSVSKSFTWKEPPKPVIHAFIVDPSTIDQGSNTSVWFTWNFENAKSASIDQDFGSLSVKTKGPTIGLQALKRLPSKTTTYTLTAQGVRPADTVYKSQTVTVNISSVTVTLTSPSANAKISDASVIVAGRVDPPPSAPAQMKASISVGTSMGIGSADVKTDGTFSEKVPLMNTIVFSDLILYGEPSVTVDSCSAASRTVTLKASVKDSVDNLIRVHVSDISDPNNVKSLGQAQATVEHVVKVNSFKVEWTGSCGQIATKNNTLNLIIHANKDSTPVGTVDFPGSSSSCSATASITVGTSLGDKKASQPWTVNCPTGGGGGGGGP